MTETNYFFDTYAFFEMMKGNQRYEKFKNVPCITTIFNLAEYNFAMKREGKTYADKKTKDCEAFLVDATIEDVFHAMDLRMANRKLSTPDVIGYAVAKRHNAKFLTGDKEFKYLPNVEFVQ